ncbi:MAG: PilT/PilU family type 4a pilus ATPase [Myxococcota bacterium]|nr:PilT/PilU family type 4a pilus ATPase [Myxococcota bacterium]
MDDRRLPLLGRIAVQLKMIDLDQLNQATRAQELRPESRLGEVMVDTGLISAQDLTRLVAVQKDLIAKHEARKAAALTSQGPPVPPEGAVVSAPGEAAATAPETPPAPAAGPEPVAQTSGREPAGDQSGTLGLALASPCADDLERLHRVLASGQSRGASDIHLHAGGGLRFRTHGVLSEPESADFSAEAVERLVASSLSPDEQLELRRTGEIDFCFDLPGVGRFRANAYRQQRGFDVVFRSISARPPTLDELGLPSELARFTNYHQGMVLVTGPAGSGKSTTLAAMVNLINEEREEHILTVEDPIEVIHPSQRCLVNQRHAGKHTDSFARALRGALREDPDVIVIGELRDLETISLAMTAAETGHFVLASLHTNNAVRTINRMIGAFPPGEQGQVRTMLSESLRAVISQRLVPKADGEGRVPALEVLVINKAIGNLVREEKTVQIRSSIQTGKAHGMYLLEQSLNDLVAEGTITREAALELAEEKKLITAGA